MTSFGQLNSHPVPEDEGRLPVRVCELEGLVVELESGVGVALRVTQVALLAEGAAQLGVLLAESDGGRAIAQLGDNSIQS